MRFRILIKQGVEGFTIDAYPTIDKHNAGTWEAVREIALNYARTSPPLADYEFLEDLPPGSHYIEAEWENDSSPGSEYYNEGWEIALRLSDDQQTPLN